jgi:hypothetical protein
LSISLCSSFAGQLFFFASGLTGKTGPHGDRPSKGLPNSDGFFMTVVILNDTQLVTMGRLYPQERPL